MAKKVFQFRGKTVEELKAMDIKDFAKLIPARQRRTLERGFTEMQKVFLAKIKDAKDGKWKKPIKTHCRDMIVIPAMLGMDIHVYNGRKFIHIPMQSEMLGHYLGEFAGTRSRVAHSAPGVGATKSSSAASVK